LRAAAADPAPGGAVEAACRPGPDVEAFPRDALERLLATEWVIHPASNRMGLRLQPVEGGPLPAPPGHRLSEPVPLGGVQVPPAGEPIVLMAARQPVGGYPLLAVVVAPDVGRLAQAMPGRDRVRFRLVSEGEAVGRSRTWRAALRDRDGLVSPL
ncbi:MAG: urea amidolyase, partial [Clostridia bacterium]|nr:urea amidolyase [Clostridia bacterium]